MAGIRKFKNKNENNINKYVIHVLVLRTKKKYK